MYFLLFLIIILIIGIIVTNPQLFRTTSKDQLTLEMAKIDHELKKAKESLQAYYVLYARTEQELKTAKSNIKDDEKEIETLVSMGKEEEAKEVIREITRQELKLKKYEKEFNQTKKDYDLIKKEVEKLEEEKRLLNRKQLANEFRKKINLPMAETLSTEDELLEAAEEVEIEKRLDEYRARTKTPWKSKRN